MLHLGAEKIDLTRIPLFRGVEDAALGDARDWVFYFRDGQKIFVQSEPADSVIVILRGEIHVLSQDMSMVTRRQSDVVGEQGFLSPSACRTADAFARGTVEVLRIPGAVVRRLLETNLQFNRNLLAIVSAKLADATSDRAFRYQNEHRLIAAFDAHLSPEITARLLSSGEEYGKPRLIDGVVLFADIRGFTTTSMTLPPDQLATELGGYLDEMVKALLEHHAYVDKFIGDAVMGVWGFPFTESHQASEALACARKMVKKAREKRINGAPVQIGVGLSAGTIFCGNVGSDLKRQFTVLGHEVNLAARCESACKDLNASIVLSEAVYNRLLDAEKSELVLHPAVPIKGVGDVRLYSIGNQEATAAPLMGGTTMSWNYNTSLNRVEKHLDDMGEIEVEKLVRDADLNSLLSETTCRDIFGAHVYVDVPNFSDLATLTAEGEDYRRVIQALHLYEREVARIVEGEDVFDGVRIHFQGAKLHALFFRPIDDAEEIATRAVLLQMVLRHFVCCVFNPEFPKLPNLSVSGGADLGSAIGTKNGHKGNRELLFLGAPANYAAKILTGIDSLRVTSAIYEALPETLQEYFTSVEDDRLDATVYEISDISTEEMDQLLAEHGIDWDRAASLQRIKDDKLIYPLNRIEYSDAEIQIDIDALGITNNKRVLAASVFGDVSGFTQYIDRTVGENDGKSALRVLHAIRKEMSAIVRHDFSGIRVQFQGDRVQALFHMPKGDEKRIAARAVDTAIALQSTMELVIKKLLPEAKELGMATGISIGTTLVSKLGTRGHRDRICIADAVEEAARYQEGSAAGEIAVPESIHEHLEEELQKLFVWNRDRGLYIGTNLTQDKVERAQKAALFKQPVYVASGLTGARVTSQPTPGSRSFVPSSSFGE